MRGKMWHIDSCIQGLAGSIREVLDHLDDEARDVCQQACRETDCCIRVAPQQPLEDGPEVCRSLERPRLGRDQLLGRPTSAGILKPLQALE